MTPQEFGALVKRAQDDRLTPMEKEAFRGVLKKLLKAPAAASRLGRRAMTALRGAPAAAATAARSAGGSGLRDGLFAGGARAVTDLGVKGVRAVGNTVAPAIGHGIAGLGGLMLYPAGAATKYVVSPAIRGAGYLLSNLAGGTAAATGNVLMDSAFSKNPLARTLQTLTGTAGLGGAVGYGLSRGQQGDK